MTPFFGHEISRGIWNTRVSLIVSIEQPVEIDEDPIA